VDRQCGSAQQAVHFAAQAVMSGTTDVIVAGGVANMSAIPIAATMAVGEQFGFPDPFSGSEGWRRRYGDVPVSQYMSAEMIARKWGASRLDMEKRKNW
jgi:acetyl-CoA C-acetyltransferase